MSRLTYSRPFFNHVRLWSSIVPFVVNARLEKTVTNRLRTRSHVLLDTLSSPIQILIHS